VKSRYILALIASPALLLGGLAGAAGALASPAGLTARAVTTGSGFAAARSVNLRALAAGPQLPAHAWNGGPLGIDGRQAGANLPVRPSTGHKPVPAATTWRAGGPNSGTRRHPPALSRRLPRTPPKTVNANFSGVNQAGADCNGCQPPDTGAAVGLTQIVEAVNLRLEVYSKTGGAACGVALNTFLHTTSRLSDPHIVFDNLNHRFAMVVTVVPTPGSTPALYMLASKTSSACGSWWLYKLTFSGSSFPKGTLLDYPYIGQDRTSLLVSANNFCCGAGPFHYTNSQAFSVAKSLVYSGATVKFSTYKVAFSSAPVTVAGIPMAATSKAYFLAAVPGFGYDLYHMSSTPGSPITLQAKISSPFTAPTRRVIQPHTSQTLDPSDGRMPATPVLSQNFVWFAHGINLNGFPAVRYGAIGVLTNAPFVATAYHSAKSDDFNPSIGIADAGTNLIYAWVNWAYTDTSQNVATTDTIDGVLPGAGVPNLLGTDRALIHGSPTSSNFRFGDFSSVEVDPTAASGTCPAGRTAVTNQEYFTSNGQWATRLARLSFC